MTQTNHKDIIKVIHMTYILSFIKPYNGFVGETAKFACYSLIISPTIELFSSLESFY